VVGTSRWRRLTACAAVLVVVIACTDRAVPAPVEEETAGPDPTGQDLGDVPPGDRYCEEGPEDGVLRWAHDQEPPDLHVDDPGNGLVIASWVQQGVFEGLHAVAADGSYVPELLAEEASVEEDDDGTFTFAFELRDDVSFSDGTPISGETIRANFELVTAAGPGGPAGTGGDTEPASYLLAPGQGYELIDPSSWEVDGQRFSFTMDGFFAGWQALFPRILPTHLLTDGETANTALRELELDGDPLPASGPFRVASWERGERLTLERNDDYHGANPLDEGVVNEGPACVAEVVIRFIPDTGDQITALRAGEVDLIYSQPQLELVELREQGSGYRVAAQPGATYEHWSLNLAHPHLADPIVREALAVAIDKRVVVESLYEPLLGDAVPATGIGNVFLRPSDPAYVDHQAEAGYGQGDHDRAGTLLGSAGYDLNGDLIWEHPERGPLALRVSTTGGNQLRERQQQLLQTELTANGWDLAIDNRPGTAHFTEQVFAPEAVACSVSGGQDGQAVTLSGGDEVRADCSRFDVAQYSSTGGPWPGAEARRFRSGSETNPSGYANDAFDRLVDSCDATVDDAERVACYDRADRFVTTREVDPDGLVVIPLTQKPQVYVTAEATVQRPAVAAAATEGGPLSRAVDHLLVP
jgi:peptide/nickel transport system substrate-binding protein